MVTVDDPIAKEIEQGFLANCKTAVYTVDICAVIPSTEVNGKYDVVMTHGVPTTVGHMQILNGCGDWYTKVNYIYKENGKDESRFAPPIYCNGTRLRDNSEIIRLPRPLIANYSFACDIDKFDFQLPKSIVDISGANINSYGKFNLGMLKLPIWEFNGRFGIKNSTLDIKRLINAGGTVDRVVLGKATLMQMGVSFNFDEDTNTPSGYTDSKGRTIKILPNSMANAIKQIMTGLNANSGKYVCGNEFEIRLPGDRYAMKSVFGQDANCEIIKDPKYNRWALVGAKRAR